MTAWALFPKLCLYGFIVFCVSIGVGFLIGLLMIAMGVFVDYVAGIDNEP